MSKSNLQPIWISPEYKKMVQDRKTKTGKSERRITEDAIRRSLVGGKATQKLLGGE